MTSVSCTPQRGGGGGGGGVAQSPFSENSSNVLFVVDPALSLSPQSTQQSNNAFMTPQKPIPIDASTAPTPNAHTSPIPARAPPTRTAPTSAAAANGAHHHHGNGSTAPSSSSNTLAPTSPNATSPESIQAPKFHSAVVSPEPPQSSSTTSPQQTNGHSQTNGHLPHPSHEQEEHEAADAANGHSHTKRISLINQEANALSVKPTTNGHHHHNGVVSEVNAVAPWQQESEEVARGEKMHHVHESSSVTHMPVVGEEKPGCESDDNLGAESKTVTPATTMTLTQVQKHTPAGTTSMSASSSPSSRPLSSPESSAQDLPPLNQPPTDKTMNGNHLLTVSPSPASSSTATMSQSSHMPRPSTAGEDRAFEVVRIDKNGNIITYNIAIHPPPPLTKEEQLKKTKRVKLDTEREMKWVRMVVKWDKTDSDKIKRRVRKGIPDSLRGTVWPRLAGSVDLMKAPPAAAAASSSSAQKPTGPGVYARYQGMVSKEQETIARDIARTFPHHVLFRDSTSATSDPAGVGANIGGAGQGKARGEDAEGQNSHGRHALYNVLKAYSLHDEQVGYCQGMGFPTGIFLMYMTEEEAFWLLHSITRGEKYLLNGLWSPGFPLLMQWYYQFAELLKKHCPRLSSHLLKRGDEEIPITPELYATQWFMTLMSYNLPMDLVFRIFDILLSEGPKIIFRLAIFFCKHLEKKILAESEFAPIMAILKNVHNEPIMSDPDAVIEGALKVDISRAELAKLGDAYQKNLFQANQEKQKRQQQGRH